MKSHRLANRYLAFLGIISGVLIAAGSAQTQQLQGKALVRALQRGGYLIVMRHASSPQTPPTKENADRQNINLERQLDESGRTAAAAFGNALRRLKIPVGQVLSSPTYRALETARFAQLPTPMTVPELGDNGRSMQNTNESQSAWLQKQITKFPRGSNTILITHQPNIAAAFPQWSANLSDGEALIFGSDGKGGATLVARVKIDEWPKLPD
ncbi:MAG TPA: histidine phosphatase family protein [Candidatus Acidoferrales bacterium]|nr:histidine phosphatase family protein [Candidatus Acidoferrales bacterium]